MAGSSSASSPDGTRWGLAYEASAPARASAPRTGTDERKGTTRGHVLRARRGRRARSAGWTGPAPAGRVAAWNSPAVGPSWDGSAGNRWVRTASGQPPHKSSCYSFVGPPPFCVLRTLRQTGAWLNGVHPPLGRRGPIASFGPDRGRLPCSLAGRSDRGRRVDGEDRPAPDAARPAGSRFRRAVRVVALDTSLLRDNPPYRRLWTGITVSQLGSQMTLVAVPVQVYDLDQVVARGRHARAGRADAVDRLRALRRRARRRARPPQGSR